VYWLVKTLIDMLSLPLSDDAWQRVSHLFKQDTKRRSGRPARHPRDVLNAILWVTTQNEKWHRLPASFPPSQTCYIKWLQWRRDGLMSRIAEELGIKDVFPASEKAAGGKTGGE
jgi:transposase